MSSNDGTRLERLVAQIEGALSPAGFKVEIRKQVFDGLGVQVAEFDIVISGQLGTSRLSFLIECRDRPSEGAAPAAWIEQLIGRRSAFQFDKVMAVSSTGFSRGAETVARNAGIDLRHLQSLTLDEVTGWLPLNAPLLIRNGRIRALRAMVKACVTAHEDAGRPLDLNKNLFVGQASGEILSVTELWRRVINNNEVWNGIPEGGPAKDVTLRVEQFLSEPYSITIDGEPLPLESIEIDATLQAIIPKMPLVEAATYSDQLADPDGKQTFATIGRWKPPGDGPIKEMTFIGFPKQKDTGDAT